MPLHLAAGLTLLALMSTWTLTSTWFGGHLMVRLLHATVVVVGVLALAYQSGILPWLPPPGRW